MVLKDFEILEKQTYGMVLKDFEILKKITYGLNLQEHPLLSTKCGCFWPLSIIKAYEDKKTSIALKIG